MKTKLLEKMTEIIAATSDGEGGFTEHLGRRVWMPPTRPVGIEAQKELLLAAEEKRERKAAKRRALMAKEGA